MTPEPRTPYAAMAVVAALLVLVSVLSTADETPPGGRAEIEPSVHAGTLADPVPYDGRSPSDPQGALRRVLVELPRPALGARRDVADLATAERRDYVVSLQNESEALRSSLDARGVKLRDVVPYDVVWNGFAATVATRDLAQLASLGIRTRTVRRFYPAVSEPVPTGRRDDVLVPRGDRPDVAVLAGGAAGLPGYDAVDRDEDPAPAPDPRHPERQATSARGPIAVVAAAGRQPTAIRVSALRIGPDGRVEEFARTDELLLGLERAVDPDGDGDPSDAVPVALVAVSAPYAGFARSPEATAAAAAHRLGTRVVAPAGHEGPARRPYGTIGSPGAAARALAVGALSDPAAVPVTRLAVGPVVVRDAAALGGRPPRKPLRTSPPLSADRPEALAGRRDVAGRMAVVRAGANPAAQAEAAASAGARAVLLAQPRENRPLPAMPAGRVPVPVLGVTGKAAEAVLAAGTGRRATAGRPRITAARLPGIPFGGRRESPFGSRGPSFDGAPKPDARGPASVDTGSAIVSGAGIAAAAVAAEGGSRRARRRRAPAPVRAPLGRLRLDRRAGRPAGVRFTVGRFERGDPAAGRPTVIVPVARLDLELVRRDGTVARRLTPPGGELGLLPAEYAYRLPAGTLRELAGDTYRFRVRAWSPRSPRPATRTSPPFRVRS